MKQDHTGLTISSCSYIGSGVPFRGRSSYEERFCGKTSRFNCNCSKSSENVLLSFFLYKTTKRYSYRKFFAVLSIILRLRKKGTEYLGNDHHYNHHATTTTTTIVIIIIVITIIIIIKTTTLPPPPPLSSSS